MSIIGTKYYNTLQQFLIYKGKKSRTESIFRNLLLDRAKKNKLAFISELTLCKYNATPHVRLLTKSKRRGKRIMYKVMFLEKDRSEKESKSSFGKYLRSQIGKKFDQSVEKEIETFSKDKTHSVRVNRDKLHQLARKYTPKLWLKKKKPKSFKKVRKLNRVEQKLHREASRDLWYSKYNIYLENKKKDFLL